MGRVAARHVGVDVALGIVAVPYRRVLLTATAVAATLTLGQSAASAATGAPAAQEDSTCWYYTGNSMVIAEGSEGPAVREAQCLLNSYNVWHGRPAIAVDGDFGPRTRSAVIDFQRRMGILVDGIVGPQTRKKLRSPGG